MRISDWSSDVCSSDLERMILGGKVYSAEEMYDMGLVHVIAETGEGEQAVRDYISENNARHSGHVGVYRAGRRVNPLQLDELKEIVENWVDTALKLTDKDLKLMRRLGAAQHRLPKPEHGWVWKKRVRTG